MRSISNTENNLYRTKGAFRKVTFVLSLAMLLFLSASLSAQVLTNQGAVISVTGGAVVDGDTIENVTGAIENAGTINLSGHYLNEATTSGDGFYNIKGNWVNSGTFLPGSSSVQFRGTDLQYVVNTGDGSFYKMIINNSGSAATGRIILSNDIEVSDTLEMSQGIVQTGSNRLFLENPLFTSLIYTSGHIIGKFERGVNSPNNYLFPVGSNSNYNPLNLKPNEPPAAGSVLSEFIAEEPDSLGLPIPDTSVVPGVEVYNIIKDGYWSLKSNNGFSTADFNVNIDGTGFTDPNAVQDITRVIKREAGAEWLIDGVHSEAIDNVAFRNNLTGNISASTTHLALGNVRPLIIQQPQDTAVCDGTEAIFSVIATGVETLYYQWQEKTPNGGWVNLDDDDIYSGTETATLVISSVNLDMDQNQYRVRISHKYGHVNWSERATLTVNPLPVALATPQVDTLCNDTSTLIELSSDVPGTTFHWVVLYGEHLGASDGFDAIEGDTIQQQLYNPLDSPDSVVYRIVPKGPLTTYCIGHADTAVVYVNPTPRVEIVVVEDTICDGNTSTITVTSPTVLTSGSVKYDFTIEDVSGVSGDVTGQNEILFQDPNIIEQTLTNHTDHYHHVEYRIHPYSIGSGRGVNCDLGTVRDTIFRIYVNPTPRVFVSVDEDTICDEQTSKISVSSPTVLTSGEVKYDLTVKEFSGEEGDVAGKTPYLDQSLGFTDHTLDNKTDTAQWVEYRVHPFTSGTGPGTNCDYGDIRDSVFRIYVNPTPNIFLTISNDMISSDTVFCNGYDVDFELNNHQLTTGTVQYHLEVTGNGVGVINGGTPTTDSLNIANFSNTLSHTDSQIRELKYRFIPYIENAYGTNGCYSGLDTTVNVKIVPVLKSEIPADTVYGGYHITCNGFSDGAILAEPLGGDYRYSYSYIWEDDLGNERRKTDDVEKDSLEDLTAGTYYYTITDTLGCYHDSLITLVEPDQLAIEDVPDQPTCFNGTNDGAIYINDVSGGAEGYPYFYEWYNENTEQFYPPVRNLEDVFTGEYTFTLTDYNGCFFTKEYKLESPEPMDVRVTFRKGYGQYGVSCTGEEDGEISITGDGGTEPYQFTWYDSELEKIEGSSGTKTGMGAGTYYCVVKDLNNCTGSDSLLRVTVREPEPIRFNWKDETYSGGWHIQCNGDENGLITPQYTGGHFNTDLSAPPREHVYTWTGPGVVHGDSIQKNLGPGTYTLHVRDIGDTDYPDGYCSADTTFELREHPAITYDPPEIDSYIGGLNVSCHDSLDGAVQLLNIAGGGTTADDGEYTYAWDVVETPADFDLDVDNLSTINNIPAGKYAFTISDQIGCTVSDTVELTQPDSLYAVTDTSLRNGYEISCFNGSDGWVSLEPFGGTKPYNYDWSDETGSATDTMITGLNEGYYSVTMTDPNGCENFYEWELQHPDTIVLNPNPILIECFGDTSTIRISPEGGVADYSYLWEGSVTSRDLTGVAEGTYHVVVTDDNGCAVSDSIYLGQRSRIMPEIVVRSDFNGRHISCYGAENAAIELLVSGGNDSDYTFEWNTSTDDNNKYNLSGLPAGTYTVNGEDASGCPFDTVKEVVQPSDINVMYTAKDPLCEGNENGSISISVVGGTPITGSPIYNYSLNGEENLPAPEFENLLEGEYVIVVIDANECADTTEVDLVAPEALAIDYETTPAECKDKADGTLTINFIDGGTMPYNINGGTSQYFDNLLPGEFVIELVDGNDCRLIDTAYIEALRMSCLSLPNAFTPNGDGANDVWILDDDENGVNDMYLYPDAELRIYNRWGEQVYYSNNVADEPWDGTYSGRDLPVDSYHYVLDLGNGDPPITGNVTIIR